MRRTTIFTLLIAVMMSIALFFLKYEVTHLEEELDHLNKAIDSNHEVMHVLRAEWSHLNDIERVRSLSHRYLELGPTSPLRIVTVDQLPPALEAAAQAAPAQPQPPLKRLAR